MRRKTHKHKRKNTVDFRIRSKGFFIGLFLISFGLFLFNPSPAEITPRNIYQKLVHTIFQPESEYLSQAYIDDILIQNGEYQAKPLVAVFENDPVRQALQPPSSYSIASVLPANVESHVAAAQDDRKWIEIDLSDQKIYAWENGEKKFEFLISSGKPWTPTVTGEFRIWIKLRHANMKGGSQEAGDYYFLPNVPYVMYFHKGYGIHGAYWHMNFGQPMSHGCVNMKPKEAGELFAWAGPAMEGKSVMKASDDNPGTKVVVHD